MYVLRLWNKLTDWILYTSFFAGLCTVSLCIGTERLLIRQVPALFTALHVFVFGSTLLVYNAHYLVKDVSGTSDRQRWIGRFRKWNVISFAAGVILCFSSIVALPFRILLVCPFLAVLSLAYSLPLLPFIRRRRLREFGWIKIMVLTGVWTIVTAALPMVYYKISMADYPFELLLRFVFMFVLCLAFDVRDMQTDLDSGIYTLPNRIGVKNSYLLMYLSLVLFLILGIVQFGRYKVPGRLAAEITTALATGLAIAYARKYPSDKAYLAFVDGMMLLYGVLIIVY